MKKLILVTLAMLVFSCASQKIAVKDPLIVACQTAPTINQINLSLCELLPTEHQANCGKTSDGLFEIFRQACVPSKK